MKTKMNVPLWFTRATAAMVAGLLTAGALAACTSPAMDPSGTTSANQCNFFNYHHDEAKNAAGAGKCTTDCDCDGMRDCRGGACDGVARPQISCNHVDYHWNEAWNTQGAGKCGSDCDCDGLRSCASGTCQGEARPTAKADPPHPIVR
jgi:hypothetical protein